MKNKVLVIAFILSIILGTWSGYSLGLTSIQYAISGTAEFLLYLSGLCIALFGLLMALNYK